MVQTRSGTTASIASDPRIKRQAQSAPEPSEFVRPFGMTSTFVFEAVTTRPDWYIGVAARVAAWSRVSVVRVGAAPRAPFVPVTRLVGSDKERQDDE